MDKSLWALTDAKRKSLSVQRTPQKILLFKVSLYLLIHLLIDKILLILKHMAYNVLKNTSEKDRLTIVA